VNPLTWRVEHFVEIDSTNTWLAQQARGGAPEGLVAYADYQSAGRGRMERQWESPLGASLLTSILLRPSDPAVSGQLVVAAVALSARAAIAELAGLTPSLKWPNDLLVGDAKLAGILTELVITPEHTSYVVGIGINLTHNGPSHVTSTSVQAASGVVLAPAELLDHLLRELQTRRAQLDTAAGRDALRAEYRAALATLGRTVRVERHDDVLIGVATDVDDEGQLLVNVSGETHVVNVGDVVHVRPHEENAS